MSTEERIIQVMGTTAQVIAVDGPPGLVDDAVAQLERLESQWSRFRPDSEISRLNERPGVPVLVSPTTFELIGRAVEGWRLTAGRFDPTLLREVRAAGYDRSFELVGIGDPRTARWDAPVAVPTATTGSRVERITLDRITGTVTLGADVQIDPGGIGKGLAADLAVERMLGAGARG
ncbi:MAG: FAD:protein FMN transferase, partial [Acidimicrobiia bacterium]|nr:FAD:protein FMN transferase [Acidimicrobiia bacterium]